MTATNLKTWIVVNSNGNAMTDCMTMEAAQKKAQRMNAECAKSGFVGSYSLRYLGD